MFAADGRYEYDEDRPYGYGTYDSGRYEVVGDEVIFPSSAAATHDGYKKVRFRVVHDRLVGDRLVMGAFLGAEENVGVVGRWATWEDELMIDPATSAVVSSIRDRWDFELNADGTMHARFTNWDGATPQFDGTYEQTGETLTMRFSEGGGGLVTRTFPYVNGVIGSSVRTRAAN
jgi:hypothetical protein